MKNKILLFLLINTPSIVTMDPKIEQEITELIHNYSKQKRKIPLRKAKSELLTKKTVQPGNLRKTVSAPALSEIERLKKLVRAITHLDQAVVKKYASPDIINRANRSERTPLTHAVVFGNGTIVDLLLKCGADPNRTNKLGNSSLHIALQQDPVNPGIIQLLLDANARIYLENKEGKTPADLFKIAQKKNPALKLINFEQQNNPITS